MLLAVPYLLAANIRTHLLTDGGPGWLILMLLFIWNGDEVRIHGTDQPLLLIRVRLQEAAARRREFARGSTRSGHACCRAESASPPQSSRGSLGEAGVQLLEELLEVFDRYRIEICEELVLVVGQRVSRERMVELVLDGLDATEDAARAAA